MRKTKTNQQHNQFYPRTVNLTKIKFTHKEMSLLKMDYNTASKNNWKNTGLT